MKDRAGCFGMLVAIAFLAGCEWETTDSDTQSWSDSYSWINFGGVYRDPAGGVLVKDFTETPGVDNSVRNERVGTGDGSSTRYAGVVSHSPVVPGSASLTAAGYAFVDNGDGTLTGAGTTSGRITYPTGAWSLNFDFAVIDSGTPILASYQYEVSSPSGGGSGVGGLTVYSLVVEQQGNLLTFTDSYGAKYSGRYGSVRTAGGDPNGRTSGEVVANFEVSGNNSRGTPIKIVGAFSGAYAAPTQVIGTGTLSSRVMEGTWIQKGGQGNIYGVTGSVEVTVPVP